MKTLLKEKREIFEDFHIPWNETIEWKFSDAMDSYPKADPQTVLDNIVKPYLEKAFQNPLETYVEWLKEKYCGRPMTKRTIKSEIGEDYFKEMLRKGILEPIFKTNFYTIVEGK